MKYTWSSPSEMLRWLDKASPSEIFTGALKCKDTHTSLTMCDHILLKTDGDPMMQARTHFLKARLFLSLDPDQSASQFCDGLRYAEGVIAKDDPEVAEATQILNTLRPPDPDVELVNEYHDKIFEYELELYNLLDEDEADEVFYNDVALSWRVLSLTRGFDNHVQSEGMALYFANTQGHAGESIIDAFKNLDKKLGAIVKRAFAVFDKYKNKHARSAKSKVPKCSIIQAGDAPGMFEGVDEVYEKVEDEYLDKAKQLTQLLATYIRNHQDEFPDLPR
jgi:Domain of unknown function (DUF4375)